MTLGVAVRYTNDYAMEPGSMLRVCVKKIQSTLVISNSKGLTEILRDIRTSTYQICRIEEKNKSNNHIYQMYMYFDSLSKRYIENIVEKRRNCS